MRVRKFPSNVCYVPFDLETGGLSAGADDILQIHAMCGDKHFSRYITPTKPIVKQASLVNKFTAKDGKLCYKDVPVQSVGYQEALAGFIDFLKNITNPVLVGHNCEKFDLKFLAIHLMKHGLWYQFLSTVTGYVDTLAVFRREYPGVTFSKAPPCN